MNVKIPVLQRDPTPGTRRFSVVDRVEVPCELVEAPEGDYFLVRLLAAGGGLASAVEITVPATEVSE